MKTVLKLLPKLVGAAVTVVFAVWLAAYLERDSCLDAGGVYRASTGFCEMASTGEYVPLFSRPGLHLFWMAFLAAVFAPGWIVHEAGRRLMRRMVRAPAT